MPPINPLSRLSEVTAPWRTLPPQVQLYLHMLFGGGKEARLPTELRNGPSAVNPYAWGPDRVLTRIANDTRDMYDPESNNYPYPRVDSYGLNVYPDKLPKMGPQREMYGWTQSLGQFDARPIGRDSVAIADKYDFKHDVGADHGDLKWLIRFAQMFGTPFNVRDTLYAPNANRALRELDTERATRRRQYAEGL